MDLELLPNNPLEHVKLRRPIIAQAVDRRVVVNPAQAKALLTAVRATYPALEAYFACLYYAALRPAEARHLASRTVYSLSPAGVSLSCWGLPQPLAAPGLTPARQTRTAN